MFGLVLLAPPATAPAATAPAAPVRVTSCHVVVDRSGGRSPAVQETIRVWFAVANNKPADIARFTLMARGRALRDFTARGLFSGGVVIADRILHADAGAQAAFNGLSGDEGECVPTYVHFVDGTVWSAPAAS
jgi:hypothetical protein